MASILKTANGWRAQIYVKGVRESAIKSTKREAQDWAAQRVLELRAAQENRLGEHRTLAEALQKYADEVAPTKRGAHWEQVRLAAFLRPKGDHRLPLQQPLAALTTEQLTQWRDARIMQVSAGTVLRDITLLGSVLEVARRDWRWLAHNPMRDVRKPKQPDHRERVISLREIRAVLRALGHEARKTRRVKTVQQAVAVCWLVALRTGMRAGELTGLTWGLVYDDYCTLPITKNGTRRDVPLTRRARQAIERMRGFDGESVFSLSAATLDALFRRARQRAGLSGFTFHDSRHTAATIMAQRMTSAGVPAQQAVLDFCKIFGWRKIDNALIYFNPTASDLAKRMN